MRPRRSMETTLRTLPFLLLSPLAPPSSSTMLSLSPLLCPPASCGQFWDPLGCSVALQGPQYFWTVLSWPLLQCAAGGVVHCGVHQEWTLYPAVLSTPIHRVSSARGPIPLFPSGCVLCDPLGIRECSCMEKWLLGMSLVMPILFWKSGAQPICTCIFPKTAAIHSQLSPGFCLC